MIVHIIHLFFMIFFFKICGYFFVLKSSRSLIFLLSVSAAFKNAENIHIIHTVHKFAHPLKTLGILQFSLFHF